MGYAGKKNELIVKLPDLVANSLASPVPIWRLRTSRDLARSLGITIQTLANWRVRDQGPRFESAPKGKGNKRLYRTSEVLEWLSDQPSWEFERQWIVARGLGTEHIDRPYIDWIRSIYS